LAQFGPEALARDCLSWLLPQHARMRILLGISGGIAAYKAPELVRALRAAGHEVRCVRTVAAAELVADAALSTVSEHRVYHSLWTDDGSIPHIDQARWAEALLIAPATANFLAKCALGLADDLLSTLYLALETDKPIWMAPAMNSVMLAKPVVQGHIRNLQAAGVRIIEPDSGLLACGEQGAGRMPDPTRIVQLLGVEVV